MLELTAKVKSLQETVNNFELAMNFMSDEDLKDENLKLKKRVYESGLEEEGKRRNIIIDGNKEAPFHKTKEVLTELCSSLGIDLTPLTVVNMFRWYAAKIV